MDFIPASGGFAESLSPDATLYADSEHSGQTGADRKAIGVTPMSDIAAGRRPVLPRAAAAFGRTPLMWKALTGAGQIAADEVHIGAAVGWLIEAQKACGGLGYAHSFHLLEGWQPAYPETSGYIIPTLWRVHAKYGDARLPNSIAAAALWLASIQQADGSFCDLHGRRQVFDTGQILAGFNFLVERAPQPVDVERLKHAAQWLCAVQERDGSFVTHAYHGVPHAYYARVGAALATAGRLTDVDAFRAAGLANLRWTLAQQQPNGFFRPRAAWSGCGYSRTGHRR
jgi:hypothetical protein